MFALLPAIASVCFAVYCVSQGMVLAGILSLAGIVPGMGFLLLLASAGTLLAQKHYLAALVPPVIITLNIWVASILKRG